MHQEPARSRPVVARFAHRWLGLPATDENIDATSNALLQASLDGTHPDGDHAVVRRLPADVRHQRRAWRDLGETRLRGARIVSLDRPIPAGGDGTLSLVDTIADRGTIDAGDEGWADERISRVLNMLHPDERRVALAMSRRYTDSWEHAAPLCGPACSAYAPST